MKIFAVIMIFCLVHNTFGTNIATLNSSNTCMQYTDHHDCTTTADTDCCWLVLDGTNFTWGAGADDYQVTSMPTNGFCYGNAAGASDKYIQIADITDPKTTLTLQCNTRNAFCNDYHLELLTGEDVCEGASSTCVLSSDGTTPVTGLADTAENTCLEENATCTLTSNSATTVNETTKRGCLDEASTCVLTSDGTTSVTVGDAAEDTCLTQSGTCADSSLNSLSACQAAGRTWFSDNTWTSLNTWTEVNTWTSTTTYYASDGTCNETQYSTQATCEADQTDNADARCLKDVTDVKADCLDQNSTCVLTSDGTTAVTGLADKSQVTCEEANATCVLTSDGTTAVTGLADTSETTCEEQSATCTLTSNPATTVNETTKRGCLDEASTCVLTSDGTTSVTVTDETEVTCLEVNGSCSGGCSTGSEATISACEATGGTWTSPNTWASLNTWASDNTWASVNTWTSLNEIPSELADSCLCLFAYTTKATCEEEVDNLCTLTSNSSTTVSETTERGCLDEASTCVLSSDGTTAVTVGDTTEVTCLAESGTCTDHPTSTTRSDCLTAGKTWLSDNTWASLNTWDHGGAAYTWTYDWQPAGEPQDVVVNFNPASLCVAATTNDITLTQADISVMTTGFWDTYTNCIDADMQAWTSATVPGVVYCSCYEAPDECAECDDDSSSSLNFVMRFSFLVILTKLWN